MSVICFREILNTIHKKFKKTIHLLTEKKNSILFDGNMNIGS